MISESGLPVARLSDRNIGRVKESTVSGEDIVRAPSDQDLMEFDRSRQIYRQKGSSVNTYIYR